MKPIVNTEDCDYRADSESVYQSLKKILDPLETSWDKLEKAKIIAIKSNQAFVSDRARRWEGYYQDLVDNRVFEALIRILKERTKAKLILTDICVELKDREGQIHRASETYTHREIAEKWGVEIEYGETPPYSWVYPPNGGLCLNRYKVPAGAAGADEIISLQKMKCHRFTGVTLSIKNFFGLMAHYPHFHSRHYFHHYVRMPYMLADLADIFQPALSILDALWSVSEREWGGKPVITNLLLAGENAVALDAVGTFLMGGDPMADLGQSFFQQERNALKIAHDAGIGPADLNHIDYRGRHKGRVGEFDVKYLWTPEESRDMLISTCEQGLYYAEHEEEFKKKYGGNYIFLRGKECVWSNPVPHWGSSRSVIPGKGALWLKYVPLPGEEPEIENYHMYEDTLKLLKDR